VNRPNLVLCKNYW